MQIDGHICKCSHLKTDKNQITYKCSLHVRSLHEELQISLQELHIRLVRVFITQRFTRVVYWNSI